MMPEVVIKMPDTIPDGPDLEQIANRGFELFQEYLPELLRQYRGQVVAIDEDSGEYFVGKTGVEALRKAEKKYQNRIFYLAVVPRHPELKKGPTPRYLRP